MTRHSAIQPTATFSKNNVAEPAKTWHDAAHHLRLSSVCRSSSTRQSDPKAWNEVRSANEEQRRDQKAPLQGKGRAQVTPKPRPRPRPGTGEQRTRRQLVDPEPDHTLSLSTDYSARATDRTASTTSHHRTLSLDRTEYSTQNTDYSHIPRRDLNDHNSPSDRRRGREPDAYTPSPTHTVYRTQREQRRSTHAATQWHTDHCPRTADRTGPHGQRATGGQRAQRRLDPEQDHTPSQCNDYSDQATHRTTSTTPRRRTPNQDRTEYSAQNKDHCHTPQHKAQHHDDRDNVPGPEPQTAPLTTEATQPRTPEDHTHEQSLSVSSGTSSTALETHSQVSAPAKSTNPSPESLPSGLDILANHMPVDLDSDPLQDSILRVLQAATIAPHRPVWSLYGALNETDQRITGTEENRDPGVYIQELRQDIQNAHQQSPEGEGVQRRVSKAGA